jgi:hypothetical protein
MQDPNAERLSSVRTYLLVGLIFEILAVILSFLFLLAVSLIFIIPLIVSAVVLMRIRRMRIAAHSGDVAMLKQNNSTVWAIIALILGGVIPGIMLIVASGPINGLAAGMPAGTFTPSQPQWTPAQPVGSTKFCTVCGAKIASSSAFCPSCGAAQK